MYFVKKESIKGFNITSMPNAEEAIVEMIKNELYTNGAIPVTIDADSLPSEPIDEIPLSDLLSDTVNHAVTIIGYEYIGSDLYWIMVNSWGNDVGYTKGTHGGLYKIKHKSARLGEFFVIFDIDI
jgi:C1A family cysteine protease